MDRLTDLVDVFLGSGAVELPKPEGIAATWHFIKGLAGNNTPAAALPFGKMTACAYSGGYSSGYGHIGINSGEALRTIMPPGTIRGFSHIHHSGTGYIDTFYNYALIAPFHGSDPHKAFTPDVMENEAGRPGFYAVTMRERNIRAELTVSEQAAHHRYTFCEDGGRIAIDFTNDGLLEERTRQPHKNLRMTITSPDTVECEVELHNLLLYFCVCCPGARASLWEKGCIFDRLPGKTVRLALGLSPRSMEIARTGALEASMNFDEICASADRVWNDVLSAIEIEAQDERDRRLFYSNLYHTLIKPSDWSGESFLYNDEDACLLDFATLWDQYKTQLPLLMTLYPELSEKITRTILAFCRAEGRMPHAVLLDRRDAGSEDKQAKMLGEHVLVDAYYRGVPMDLDETARQIRNDVLPPERFADYKLNGICDDIAHTIDLADGMNASYVLAKAAGDRELAEYCSALSRKWVNAFDPETGLLNPNSRYYEGSHWNYSFRLMHDMPTRLNLAGSRENYAALLDRFFGYTCPEDVSARFEGFNNETDMETPYAYYYADRHDRVCEIVSAGLEYMFCEGRGGIPGNNDSGGLSSLYLWNMMGVFPVSGQDLMMIGSPRLKKAAMHLANGNTFTIRRSGKGIYVKRAELNGKPLSKMSFTVQEMMKGGTLRLEMSEFA